MLTEGITHFIRIVLLTISSRMGERKKGSRTNGIDEKIWKIIAKEI